MISYFFIDRPIFATVLSVVITLIGGIALIVLPVGQYPRITPPGVVVSITYPGASAQVVADTVAAPIEQQVNGVSGMLYMSSQMGNDGSYSLTVTFDLNVDLKTALVMVQNRVALAMPQLPLEVQSQGITIRKKTPDILLVVNFYSPDHRYDDVYLSNYATIYVKDELLRVPGVSDITYQGERDYSIRAWVDPQKMAACSITAADVAAAISGQNLDAPVGQTGQPPAKLDQSFQVPITTLGRLSQPEDFGNIIVKVGQPRSGAPASQSSGSAGGSGTTGTTTTQPSSSTPTVPAASASGSTSLPGSNMTDTLPTGTSSPSTGGGTTSGGGATSGGGVTTGGGATAGGGTTGGAAGGTMANPSVSGSSGTSGSGAGIVTSGAQGRGPGLPSASIVRLRDVARLELGSLNYTTACTYDGNPSVGLSVYQLPGTNALDVADAVRAKMDELATRFPDGVKYEIGYDTTPFIRESVLDVLWTLLEAVVLVGVVVFVFLQSWRSVLIPLIAVPVAIIGTFSVMAALTAFGDWMQWPTFQFSLNNISLFGLVLAIGIVVDDAIVVVENVERWLEHGMEPRAATRKAMGEVTGPIVAVALVLCAVFVPCAFISGITGQFFRQFGVTIAVSTIFSTFNSLTLSPALAAILLKPKGGGRDLLLGWFFWLFNKGFGLSTSAYAWTVGKFMRLNLVVLLAYCGLLGLTWWTFQKAPTGFIPQQDQGRLIVNVQLPDSASLERTQEIVRQVEDVTLQTDGVAHTVAFSGTSFLLQASSPNFASMLVVLKPFGERPPDTEIMAELKKRWGAKIKDAVVTVYGASPIPGLGTAGGFKILVEDRGGLGLPQLQQNTEKVVAELKKQPGLNNVATQFRSNTPQYYLDIDREKAAALGVSLTDVNLTLDLYLGSQSVGIFNDFGRHWQVVAQADGQYRNRIEAINLYQVRNNQGQMVPLGTLVTSREVGGPISMTRYNLSTAASITGNIQGVSSGDAIKNINRAAGETLPLSMKVEWTEVMFMQIRAGNTAMYIFLLSILCVFLALAALYESWSLPLAVILVVPLCLLCSVASVLVTNRDVNIFVQIGLVVLVGLACKNAILIVEFAKQMHREGRPLFEATQEASRLRLRPILMTSFAFIFGVVPLMLASGAGAEMRRSLGTAVFSGMLGVTAFGIFLTPVFFYVIQQLGESRLFASPALRWFGSVATGAFLGGAVGFLLAQLNVGRHPWGPLVGAACGFLIVAVLLELNRLMQRPAFDFYQRMKAPANGEATRVVARSPDRPYRNGESGRRSVAGAAWHGLPTVPRNPTAGLPGPRDSAMGSGRPSVRSCGSVRRPCHNGVGRR